jgi:hypothetical protein
MAEFLGCSQELDGTIAVEFGITSIPNVPRLSWSATEELQPYVVTDTGRTEWLESPVPEATSTSGEVLVLGIPFLQESWSVVVAETEQGLACSEAFYLEPASLDPGIPELTLTESVSDLAMGGYTVMGLITDGASFVVIVNEHGEYVWADTMRQGVVSRAVFAEDSTSILYMTWAENVSSKGKVYRLGYDGEVQESLQITGAHTDFVQLPDGGIASIAWDLRLLEDEEGLTRQILGDSIVELDSEGEERVVWSAFDVYEPDLSHEYTAAGTVGGGEDFEDWSHGNGLSYDAEQDDFLISLFGLGSMVRVDRETGATRWILSDSHGDFVSSTKDRLIQGTHSVEALADDRLLVFNRNIPNPLDLDQGVGDMCSEALEIELDFETGEATKVWSYGSEECVLVVYFGEAIRLENENTLVIFSSSGQISETNAAGETVWQINTDVGAAFGFGERSTSLY